MGKKIHRVVKRVNPNPGAILEIDLGDGHNTYARFLSDIRLAVYDARSKGPTDPIQATSKPVLFVVHTWDKAIKDGRWPVVAELPLAEGEFSSIRSFTQDPVNPEECQILVQVGQRCDSHKATIEECEGLERSAVWAPEQLVRRIADHYSGVPNADLAATQLIRRGQVFSIVLYRETDSSQDWIVSGRVHATVRVGDVLATASDRPPTATVVKIETYVRDRELELLENGHAGTLHLAADNTLKSHPPSALFKGA